VSVEPRDSSSGFFMLVARRDPPFHGNARDISPVDFDADPRPRSPRAVRFVTAIQMIGSLLALPVGIASAYTFYRANFSPETTCQSLRSGIIGMLDKGLDASTRRILVRRDVESFEKTCAVVDPEATAAFKALLAAEKSPPVAAAAPVTKAQPDETVSKEQVHKAEPRPQATPKQSTANTQAPAAQNVRREPAVSDTQWLDAVRQALVTHRPDARPAESSKARPMLQPTAHPIQRDAEPHVPPAIAPSVSATATAPAATASPVPAVAPTLPPPVSIAPAPAQQDVAQPKMPDHPIPPGSIPSSEAVAGTETKTDESGRSRIGKWISSIPLLGNVVDNGRH
jgi:hypothetical protein